MKESKTPAEPYVIDLNRMDVDEHYWYKEYTKMAAKYESLKQAIKAIGNLIE